MRNDLSVTKSGSSHFNRDAGYFVVGAIVLNLLLCYSVSVVGDLYSKYGIIYDPRNYASLGVSSLIVGILAYFLFKSCNLQNASSAIAMTLFSLSFVGNCAVWWSMNASTTFLIFTIVYWIFIIAFLRLICSEKSRWRAVKEPPYRLKKDYLGFFILAVVLVLVGLFFAWGLISGFQISFDLTDATELRMASREALYSGWMTRLVHFSACIVIPLGASYFITKKSISGVAVMTLLEIVAYSVAGTKTYLFTFVVCCILSVMVNKDRGFSFFVHVPLFLGAIVLLSCILYMVGSDFVMNYVTRRVILTTSFNNWQYVEFFLDNDKLYMLNGALSFLTSFGIKFPYNEDNFSSYMGGWIYGDVNTNASNGMVGDAYANFGLVGLVLFPLLLMAALYVFDCCTRKIMPVYTLSTIISFCQFVLNGTLVSVLVSYGFVFAILIFFLISKCGYLRIESRETEGVAS